MRPASARTKAVGVPTTSLIGLQQARPFGRRNVGVFGFLECHVLTRSLVFVIEDLQDMPQQRRAGVIKFSTIGDTLESMVDTMHASYHIFRSGGTVVETKALVSPRCEVKKAHGQEMFTEIAARRLGHI